jgi:type I restriction enzyme S subunit
VEWCDGPFWVIDTAYFASVNPDVDLKSFYYIVKYVGLNHLSSGEKPGLQRDTFRAQLFPFPKKDVQTDIALVLSALDDKIASNRDVNARLEAFSAALFNSWFVDFDPAVAKRDGKVPVALPTEAINFFPSHFEESEVDRSRRAGALLRSMR